MPVFSPELSLRRVHCISLVDTIEWSIPDTSTDVQLLVTLWYCPLLMTIVASFKEGSREGQEGSLISTLEGTRIDVVCGGHLCIHSYMLTYKLSFLTLIQMNSKCVACHNEE